METCSCFSVVAAALCVLTVLWKLRQGRDAGYRTIAAAAAAGTSLFFIVSPALWVGVLLSCSLCLLCVNRRRSELLPGENRAVLITGNTHTLQRSELQPKKNRKSTAQTISN